MAYVVYRVVRSRVGWAVVNGADVLREFPAHDMAVEDAIQRANDALEAGVAASYEVVDGAA